MGIQKELLKRKKVNIDHRKTKRVMKNKITNKLIPLFDEMQLEYLKFYNKAKVILDKIDKICTER
jgi:hypothetical protein